MGSFRCFIWEMIYGIEHSIELPVELLFFQTTRFTNDSWFGRCFCARSLAAIDKVNYYRFCWHLLPSGSGKFLYDKKWMDKWREYVRWHNSMIMKIIECDDYPLMCERSGRQFNLIKYDACRGFNYLIPNPNVIKPTKERMEKWLIHF